MTIDKEKLKAAAVDWGNHAMEIPAPEVLALIAEIDRLQSEAVYSAAGFDAAREEIGRLKAELAGLRTGFDAQNEVIAGLKAERELFRLAGESLSEDVKRLKAENEALLREVSECAAVLPGVTYMDLPDGGAPTIPEQLSRMAKDAERYRWLRQRQLPLDGHDFLSTQEILDVRIDSAIAKEKSHG